ncbi:hypothetical protein D1872_81140 [compost metagenome]
MGKKPNRELLNGIFREINTEDIPYMRSTSGRPKKQTATKPTAKDAFMTKLQDEDFESFTQKDWISYFVYKAAGQGIKYVVGNYPKAHSIIKSLMNEMHYDEIKRMIDFLFDSDQDIHPKQTIGIQMLSGGWINTVYQNSILWEQGKYTPRNKKAPSRTREWVASRKDAGTGIRYGQPARNQNNDEDETPKRGRIRL